MQGKSISGYTLQHPIGTGGMAEVWYAENKIGKKAAVKMLLTKLSKDENVVSRFLTEAKVMVELNHPNIRQVYDYGDIDSRPAIVMEYLDGNDLKARMKCGQRFTETELEEWWNQLVDALNYTHQKGIIHRDIKPGNIFVDNEGNVKLLDFGIAKVRESISKTQTGQKLGTLMYMSPEQVKDSKHIDYRTDVYSLAVTFVHLITGKKPYNSDTTSDFEISEQIVYKPLDLSGLPKDWQGFLTPYLNKEPNQRPALRYFEAVPLQENPAANNEDEETIVGDAKQTGTESQPKPATLAPEPSVKPKSKKGVWIGLGVATAALVALLVVLLIPRAKVPQTDPDTEAYEACQNIDDYRTYIRDFGRNAIHYNEAQQFVNNHVADSIAQVQQALAEAQAKELAEKEAAEKAEAELKAQAEAEKKEDAAFKKCTTIANCNAYLKNYPKGRYVEQVMKKKKELEEAKEEEENLPNPLRTVSSSPAGTLVCTYYFAADKSSINNGNVNKTATSVLRDEISKGITGFRIEAMCVPEEGLEIAQMRANAVQNEIAKLLKNSSKIYDIRINTFASDLEMVMTLISVSNIKDKASILEAIRSSHNRVRTFEEICMIHPEIEREVFPQLRCVKVFVY